jgi:small conductance mechanosensitive channel
VTCGTLTLLDEIGLPVGPLMGGAAVVGLAIAFGAQNLIKDFFTGFMILLEQQYMVNDVVKIGNIAGQVERISLRMTTLRDLEGRVHFMPHGNITAVTNMTHGWSRAVFDIDVAYKEDVDRVIEVLLDLGQQLRRDPEYGPLILDDPTMLGVDAFGDSAVTIKFYLKTRPLRQWPVKRELLRRIKNRFDELGIEIPFPHRTLYHHHSTSGEGRGRGHDEWSDEHQHGHSDDRSAA